MRRAGLLALAAALVSASILALGGLGACFVPAHRFDEFLALDGQPSPDAGPPETISIPSGTSLQGIRAHVDSEPVHRVYTSGFEITKGCVTDAAYGICVSAGACPPAPDDGGQIGLTFINIEHAGAYCAFVGMRVPTEAELERAARGDLGALTTQAPSPHGLDACDFGNTTVVVSDGYKCDGYVGRAWANPREDGFAFARLFSTSETGTIPLPIPARTATTNFTGIRCARTVDTAPPPPPPNPVCSGSCDVSSVAIGERFGCALRADGSVWCWGSNEFGQLGNNDVIDAMPASLAPNTIALGVDELDAGNRFACARKGGVVECWGDNSLGQIPGAGGGVVNVPTQITTGATDLAVAGDHGCVINTDTTISCWGNGGANPTSGALTSIGFTGATAIEAGARSECAIVGATVQCWGMLPDAGGTQSFVPPATPRSFALAATQIAVGDGHGCAVVGTNVQCWGIRGHWSTGTGIATSPEIVTTTATLVAPKVFASDAGTVIFDQGAVALNVNTSMGALAIDGASIAFAPGTEGSGCATVGAGASCFGIEKGELGRSNACDAMPMTSALVLPTF